MRLRFILLTASLFAISCSTTPSKEGQGVVVAKSVMRTCEFIETLQDGNGFGAGPARLRNQAAAQGATHIVFLTAPEARPVRAQAFYCPSIEELADLCEVKKVGVACLDYGLWIQSTDVQAAFEYLQMGCKLKNAASCEEMTRISTRREEEKIYRDMVIKCNDGGDARICLRLMAKHYQSGDLDEAIKFAQLACINGDEKGCSLHRDLVGQRNENSRSMASEKAARINAYAVENQTAAIRQIEAGRQLNESINQLSNSFKGPKTTNTNCSGAGNNLNCTTTEY